ncbi:MAG: hypothetical protein JWQ10_1789 [Herbaspirillum sp.]|nr:hypothetical protein [Herbaspirillum sp.]
MASRLSLRHVMVELNGLLRIALVLSVPVTVAIFRSFCMALYAESEHRAQARAQYIAKERRHHPEPAMQAA